jgi:hypothetical protein
MASIDKKPSRFSEKKRSPEMLHEKAGVSRPGLFVAVSAFRSSGQASENAS